MFHSMSGSVAPTQSAVRRLQRDLQELKENPLANIAIQVDERDMFQWSVNLVAQGGQWRGIPVHLHLMFPPDYPNHAPRVNLETNLSGHPNVFGSYVCLDMLKDPGYYAKPFSGWSSAYTASTLLAQLYGFLLVDTTLDQDYGNRSVKRGLAYADHATRMRDATHVLANCRCGFTALPPAPSLPSRGPTPSSTARASAPDASRPRWGLHSAPAASVPQPTQDSSRAERKPGSNTGGSSALGASLTGGGAAPPVAAAAADPEAAGTPFLDLLDDLTLRQALGRLGPADLWQCIAAGGRAGRVARDLLQRSELVCFHSKVAYTEAVLGFGVGRQWHSGKGASSTSLKALSSKTDYLSLAAYREDGARRSAWNMPFDAFLPLYLNPEHGQRSLLEVPACVRGMLSRECVSGYLPAAQGREALRLLVASPDWSRDLLQVLAQLINSFIVEVVSAGGMGGCAATNTIQSRGGRDDEWPMGVPAAASSVGRSMSDAALQGFCHLHHLLLALALQPGSILVQQAQRDVKAFVAQEAARHKSRCPDLGLLLVKYMLVPREEVPWADFAPPFIRELLARQVRWVLPKAQGRTFGQPFLERAGGSGESLHDFERLKDHFEASLTSMRNVLLQAWFANALARPKSSATCLGDLRAIKAAYDECSGLPPRRAFSSFNTFARQVMGCGSWTQSLKHLRLGLLADRHPRAQFVAMLRQAVLDSHRSGYHSGPNPFAGTSSWAKAPDSKPAVDAEGFVESVSRAKRAPGPPCFVDWSKRPVGVISDSWL